MLGINNKLEPTGETKKNAYNVNLSLPETMTIALDLFSRSKEIKEIYGDIFIELFCAIKELEVGEYNKIVTSWEREYLLINV